MHISCLFLNCSVASYKSDIKPLFDLRKVKKVKKSHYMREKGPERSRKVEAPQISRQSAHEDGKVVSLTHRPTLPPRKISWLEVESTPVSQCGRKDYVNENV